MTTNESGKLIYQRNMTISWSMLSASMNILMLFLVYFAQANNIWKGTVCHPSSNSSKFEISLAKCANKDLQPFLNNLEQCFYWIRGKFTHAFTSSRVKNHHNHRHVCSNYLNLSNESRRTIYRNTIINTFKLNNTSMLHRNRYDCNEELPFGYYHNNNNSHLNNDKLESYPYYWYTRQELYPLLQGKILWFHGNSMTRQLFQRIIMFIRNMHVFFEHFAHRDMIYGFDANVDFWEICEKDNMNGHCSGSTKFWSYFTNKSNVALLYFSFSNLNIGFTSQSITNFEHIHINIHNNSIFKVIGMIKQVGSDIPHWIFTNLIPHSYNDYTTATPTTTTPTIPTTPTTSIHTDSTVHTDTPTTMLITADTIHTATSTPTHTVPRSIVTTLNMPMDLWSPRLQPPLPNWSIRNNFMYNSINCRISTINDAHFQCGAALQYPQNIIKMKIPKYNNINTANSNNNNCYDSFNLNIIQRYFMFLFDKQTPI